jgi:hypothetical protein
MGGYEKHVEHSLKRKEFSNSASTTNPENV